MTLILTLGTPDAIVVAADSALTQNVRMAHDVVLSRVLHGVQKVFAPVGFPGIVSSWGDATLTPRAAAVSDADDVPVQLWLSDFIARSEALTDAATFVSALRDELNTRFEPVRTWAGFDLAFFDRDAEGSPASVARVVNGRASDALYANFQLRKTAELKHGEGLDRLHPQTAGDEKAELWLDEFRRALNGSLARRDRPVDTAEPEWLARYASLLVGTVANARSVLNVGQSIGGEITTAILRRTSLRPAIRGSPQTRRHIGDA